MQARIGLLILVGLFSTIHIRASASDQGKYVKVFLETTAKVNAVLKSDHEPVLTFDENRLAVAFSFDRLRKRNLATVSSSSGISVEIDPESMAVTSFSRDIPLELLGSYDAPPKPSWSKEQAIAQAKIWVKCFLGYLPTNIKGPTIEFSPQMNLPKYRDGQWEIRWQRIDLQGHIFDQDSIYLILNEKFGITFLGYNFVSAFTEGQKVVLSREQAIDLGRESALKILQNPMAASWLPGARLGAVASAGIYVVNPNHILRYKSLDEMITAPDTTARLAWVIKYQAVDPSGNSGSHDVGVWIDTETKEMLGGDFQ
jgi:hypothetical protein